MVRMMVSIDEDLKERAVPLLRREGLTVSSFLRKSLADFCESQASRNKVITISELDALDDIEARR